MNLLHTVMHLQGVTIKQVSLDHSHTVGVYIGSFDPLHQGHETIIHNVLQSYCDYVIVVADNYYNPKKPHRTAYHIRQEMLYAAFEGHSRIIISDMPQAELFEYLQTTGAKIYGILGSDCAYEQTVSDFIAPYWLIVPRKEHEQHIKQMHYLSGSPVIVAPFYSIDISSTLIKEKIKQDIAISADELNPAVIAVIKKYQLYN